MQHRKMLQALKPYIGDGFFFVNIGANDGITNDPIYPLIQKYSCSGIAVEPEPACFLQLKKNMAPYPGIICENIAISDTPLPLYHLSDEMVKLEPILNQLSSFDRHYLEMKLHKMVAGEFQEDRLTKNPLPAADVMCQHIIKSHVECMSFNELMKKHNVQHIDFLNIDAELFDYPILASIDFSRYAPRVLCIESIVFDGQTNEQFQTLMQVNRYKFLQRFGLPSEIYVREF